MNCASCGRANRDGARFCGGCGGSLAPRCPACGAAAAPDARFCDACGAPMAGRPAEPSIQRKVVTIVFADLIGSTALHERLDPESVRRIMEGYHGSVRVPVEAHGGTVVQLLGDGVMCAFGIPRVTEDDALRAVRAAVDVQRAFREFVSEHPELAGRVGLRVAVNTGEVVVSDDYAAGIGDPLNVAARLQQEARDGDVLIGGATQRFVASQVTLEPIGRFALKGRAEPVAAWRVVSLDPPERAAATPFVGRDAELRRLAAVYEAAVAAPAARLALLLGSPGLGKSRLLAELAHRLGDVATVLTAQCVASVGATFAPLADALRSALDAAPPGDAAERARIEAGIGALLAGTPAPPEETFFVVRRLLAALATQQPVVLVIDDLQWAEPLLLDLIEHLVQWGADVPLLVLAAARPELRDVRSSLTSAGGVVSEVVTLAGLDAGAATRLAASLIGAEELPAALAGRVLATSEGNPLFLGELVRMLVNDGALKKDGERWTVGVDLAALDMPPTIQALLAARIERLRPEDRLVLEHASVIGRQFSRAAVGHLLPQGALADLDARLESLRRGELIEPDGGWLLGEPMLRFHHSLIRDAAYRRLLKNARAELHTRFAEWLEGQAGESALHEETLGWHLEQAHQHLREIGPLDANGRALGERAARYLASAGRRALGRDDLPPAASLLGRALACLDAADPERAELALDWCEALLSAGDVGPAARALEELGRFTAGSERLRAWHTCFSGQLAVLTDPQALRTSIEAVAAAAETLAAAGDAAGEAKAHWVHAIALSRLGQVGACEAALDRALAAARRVRGDRRRANAVLSGAPLAALWGPSPVTRASGRCLDVVRVLRITQGAPAVEAVALRCQGVLETLRGRGDAARRMLAASRHMVEELGITQRVLEADLFAGLIELLEGDAAGAERPLRSAYEGLRARGLGIDAAQAAALLGRALLAQGRAAEAETLSHESEALAGDDLKAAIAWRGVRAESLAKRGEGGAAIDLARQAVEIAAATDALLDHADARQALAAALRAAGRIAEAEAEEQRAIELWEAKGATLLAERARRGVGPRTQAEPRESEGGGRTPAALRPVRPNAATAEGDRLAAVVSARDVAALESFFPESLEIVEHPTGAVFDGRKMLSAWRALLRAEAPALRNEWLATLGDRLALARSSMSFAALAARDARAVGSFGAVTRNELVLIEVGADGRQRHLEMFAPEQLGAATARAYERYARLLPEGAGRTRALATAKAVAALLGPPDPERWRTVFAPDIEFIDARSVGFGRIRGAEAVLEGIRALFELSSEFATRIDEVLWAEPGALLVRISSSGTLRASGGEFERDLCHVWCFGEDGRLVRWEQSDGERAVEALARLDALAAAQPVRRVRPNAATAGAARLSSAIAARDEAALPGLLAADYESVHHPTGTVSNARGPLAVWHQLLGATDPSLAHEPLASLGDSLALLRQVMSFSALTEGDRVDVGAAVNETVVFLEVDSSGLARRVETFDEDRLGAATARLYERYAELLPDGQARVRAAATARSVGMLCGAFDSGALGTVLAPDAEYTDHRPLGFGALHGADAIRRWLATLSEGAVDVTFRLDDVIDLRSDRLLARWTNLGTERLGGGAFERSFIALNAFDRDGFLRCWEHFDAGRPQEALARFDELVVEPSPARFENAATRAQGVLVQRWRERRLSDVIASLAPDFVLDDRRPLVGLRLSRDDFVTNLRVLSEVQSSQWQNEPLATRGELLTLSHVHFAGATEDGTEFVEEHLSVFECDADGRWLTVVVFDLAAKDAAYAELEARYAAAHPRVFAATEAFRSAFAARDWAAIAEQYVPDVVVHDHRLLGWEPLHGAEAYVESLRTLVELAPDVQIRSDHIALNERGLFWVGRWSGTREGGSFDSPWIVVSEHDAGGRVVRFDTYDLDQEGAARARFAELGGDPLRIPPNAATGFDERLMAVIEAHDWEGAAALIAEDASFEDRRRGFRLSGGRDLLLTNIRYLGSRGVRSTATTLATAGDRLALQRFLYTGSEGTAPFEIENLQVTEVDAEGRLLAAIVFDPDARRAASDEMFVRFGRGEGAAHVSPSFIEFVLAMNAHDRERARALLPDDFVFDDHRRTGVGRLGNADDYVASLAALWEESADASSETLYYVDFSERGYLNVGRMFGTLSDGGEFESLSVRLGRFRDGQFVGAELFELEDLERARARFEELRPDPLRIPRNAAARATDRIPECIAAEDWDSLRALTAPDFVFDDRRRRALVSGDVELYVRNLQVVRAYPNLKTTRELLGTVGQRISVARLVYSGGPEGSAFEGEFLLVTEVDAAGRVRSVIHFDPEDRGLAFVEAHERFAAHEASASPAQAVMSALVSAFTRHDREALRACFAPDARVHDRRTLGFGELGIEQWIDSMDALSELAPDSRLEPFHILRWTEHGRVVLTRICGTREGGPFEIVHANVFVTEGGRISAFERFDPSDVARALARFAELSGG